MNNDTTNQASVLYNRYGIVSELDNTGRVRFSGVGKHLSSVSHDDNAWHEIMDLMIDVEQHARDYLKRDDRIIVTGQRQVLVLMPDEIRELLIKEPSLYTKAIVRGKSVKRTLASERRR